MQINWHKQKNVVDELVDQAALLLQDMGTSHVISIGQSPAWLCKAASVMAKQEELPNRFVFMPFSKSFCQKRVAEPLRGGGLAVTFDIRPPFNMYLYRRRLNKLGLSPDKIIRTHQDGSKTLFIDYIHSGSGIASFMHVLLQWAADEGGDKKVQEFAKAVRVRGLFEKDITGFTEMWFDTPAAALPLERQNVSTNFTHYFADSPNTNPDRLVAFYPESAWKEEPKPVKVRELVAEIGSIIGMAAITYKPPARPRRQRAKIKTAPKSATDLANG